MEIKCAKCKKEFEYSKEDVKKHYRKLSIHNFHYKKSIDFVICPYCQNENFFEEKLLLNKCGICGGNLYEHTALETANSYIYCPKCKEEADKVKARMTDEQARGFLAFTKMLGITDNQVDEIKEKFDTDYKKQILTDICNYLVKTKELFEKTTDFKSVLFGAGVQVFVEQALSDLTEYAEKLGVEL